MAVTQTMQFILSIVLVLFSSNMVKSEPNLAPTPWNSPNFQASDKFDVLAIQECTTSVLSVKDCIIEILTPFFTPGVGGSPPGDVPPGDGGDVPPGGGGDVPPGGGILPGVGGGVLPGAGGGITNIGNWFPGNGRGLPGISGPRDFIKPACCKAIIGIKTNCWPIVFPNPFFPSLIESICSAVI